MKLKTCLRGWLINQLLLTLAQALLRQAQARVRCLWMMQRFPAAIPSQRSEN